MSTTTDTRIPLEHAEELADDIVALLKPYCERIAVAGSIRRRKPDVGDIEIVAIPRVERIATDLFSQQHHEIDLLHEYVTELRSRFTVIDRFGKDGKGAFGRRYKRLVYQGVALDLFTANHENWGLQYTLRTGPASFNRRLVVRKHDRAYMNGVDLGPGFLPFGFRVGKADYKTGDSYLWRGDTKIPTPEERDLFEAIGLDWLEPEERA